MKNSVGGFSRVFIYGIICLLVACFSVQAESSTSNEWEYQLTLYGWLAGQNGTVATLPGLPPTDIDVDFYDDILGNINFALFLVGEAHKGRWGGLLDIAYTDIEDENALPNGILWSSAISRTKSWMVSAAGLYRLVEKQRAFVDAVGGIRYWNIDSELALTAALLPDRKISNREDWIDPIVGLKGLSFLGDSKFFLQRRDARRGVQCRVRLHVGRLGQSRLPVDPTYCNHSRLPLFGRGLRKWRLSLRCRPGWSCFRAFMAVLKGSEMLIFINKNMA